MKNMKLNLLSMVVFACIMVFSGNATASSYELEATGKNQEAALGNIKMAALRAELQKVLTKDEMKKNSKILRNEIFLKVNELAHETDSLSYESENKKVRVKGLIEVDSDKILSILGKVPLVKNNDVKNESVAVNPQTAQNAAQEKTSAEKTEPALETAQTATSEKTSAEKSEDIQETSQTELPADTDSASTETALKNEQAETKEEQEVKSEGIISPEGFEVLKVAKVTASPEENVKFRMKLLTAFTKFEELEELLNKGCDPNYLYKTNFGYSSKEKGKLEYDVPLLFGYVDWKQAKPEVVKLLCESGAWYNWQNAEGTLSLAEQIIKSKEEIINYWLGLKPDLKRLKLISVYNGVEKNSLLMQWLLRKDSKEIKDHLGIFRKLLESGADPNVELNHLPLIFTVYDKAGSAYVKEMLDHGADPNTAMNNVSLLTLVLKENDDDLLSSLIAHGLNVKESKGIVYSYLGMFYMNNRMKPSLAIIRRLVEAGADYNYETDDAKNSLADAIFDTKDYDIAEYYLSLNPDLKNLKAYDRVKTELLKDLFYFDEIGSDRHKNLLRKLIELGCDPNGEIGRHPALDTAYEKGGIEYARILLASGADANALDHYKDPLIFSANGRQDLTYLKLLKEYKADMNALNHRKDSILSEALDKDSTQAEYIQSLISLGCDVNAADRKGNTALMQAVSDYDTNKEAIVEILLKNGSDVNAVDKNKRTALMKAIYEPKEPYPGVIEKLIANGAKLDLQDKDGATALTYAVSVRKPDIVKLLLDNNADAKLALSVKAKVKNSDGKYEEKTLKQIIKESEREDVKELKSVLSKYL